MDQERRQAPRYEINQLVELEFAKETFINAESKNISTRGIACTTAQPIELYARMFFMLRLDPDESEPEIRGEGLVIRRDLTGDEEYEVGLEFTDVPSSMLRKIEVFLAE